MSFLNTPKVKKKIITLVVANVTNSTTILADFCDFGGGS
jgi:hypothetical protein